MFPVLMVCACAATSETAKDDYEAEHGDDCRTIGTSLVQTQAVLVKTRDHVKEPDEAEHKVENVLEQSVETKVIKHGLGVTSLQTSQNGPPKCGFAGYFYNHTKGPGIHKWEHYFQVYEDHLWRYCPTAGNRPIRMMEIGIQSGGSMMMWRHAFGANLVQLIGVDINPKTKSWERFGPNVKVEIGSQADPNFLKTLTSKYRDGLDLIVDDGSHLPVHNILTFSKLWPHVRAGGVYIIEDVHGPSPLWNWIYFGYKDASVDWPGIMGPEQGPGNEINQGGAGFFNQYVRKPNPEPFIQTASAIQAEVYSVNAYPYLLVIQKREQPMMTLNAPRHGTQWIPY